MRPIFGPWLPRNTRYWAFRDLRGEPWPGLLRCFHRACQGVYDCRARTQGRDPTASGEASSESPFLYSDAIHPPYARLPSAIPRIQLYTPVSTCLSIYESGGMYLRVGPSRVPLFNIIPRAHPLPAPLFMLLTPYARLLIALLRFQLHAPAFTLGIYKTYGMYLGVGLLERLSLSWCH